MAEQHARGMNAPDWEAALAIPGFMSRDEMAFIAREASKVSSWTELGGFIGRSFLCAGLALPKNSLIQVVDMSLGYHYRYGQTLLTTYEMLARTRPDLEIILCRSMSDLAATKLGNTDVTFIDASHSYESVVKDIKAWRKKSAILMGHDYHHTKPGVVQAVDELCPSLTEKVDSVWKKVLK